MIFLSILRVYSLECTIGAFLVNGSPFGWSLEPPWCENKPNVSCIPPRSYECKMFLSSKFGLTLKVDNVPDRTGIIFHSGNVVQDTKGCILLGMEAGEIGTDRAVLRSTFACNKLMEIVKGHEIYLSVKEI